MKLAGRVDGMLLICPAIITDFTKQNVPEYKVLARDAALLARLTAESADGFRRNCAVLTEEVYARDFG